MDTVETRALDLLARELGARRIGRCPSCAGRVDWPTHPAGTLCLRCTEAELGISAAENAARIGAELTIRQWLSRPVDDPFPSPKARTAKRRMFGR